MHRRKKITDNVQQKSQGSNMCIRASLSTGPIFIILAAFALSVSAIHENDEWLPTQTRSGPIPFAPEFLGKVSDDSRPEAFTRSSSFLHAVKARSPAARKSSSPITNTPKISSVNNNDLQ
jgi:hypothetical protein